MSSGEATRFRPPVLLAIFGGLVVAILVIGAVAGALREPVPLDPETPEGITQRYLQAVFDRDFTGATEFLSEEAAERCDVEEFGHAWIPESLTATLDEVSVGDGQATLTVQLRAPAGPEPFNGGGYSFEETFALVQEGGQWRLDGEPWPMSGCMRAP